MNKVAVVIPCVNLWNKYTKPCIDSVVKACEGLDYRILLIDNASSDETREGAHGLLSSTFAHQRNETCWGCAQSWNFGVKDALERGFDYVFIINNDVLLHPESVRELIGRFENDISGQLAMVTCLDVTGECPEPLAVFDKKVDDKRGVAEAEHPCFSGFMIDRNCFERIGEFDERFFPAYFEDNDYHYRINLSDMKAIVLPTSMFYHYGSATRNESGTRKSDEWNRLFEANRDYYKEKWGGLPGNEQFKTPFNQ